MRKHPVRATRGCRPEHGPTSRVPGLSHSPTVCWPTPETRSAPSRSRTTRGRRTCAGLSDGSRARRTPTAGARRRRSTRSAWPTARWLPTSTESAADGSRLRRLRAGRPALRPAWTRRRSRRAPSASPARATASGVRRTPRSADPRAGDRGRPRRRAGRASYRSRRRARRPPSACGGCRWTSGASGVYSVRCPRAGDASLRRHRHPRLAPAARRDRALE